MNEKLIKQLQQEEIAVHNDGTLEELRKVLKYAFPEDDWSITGASKYYISSDGTQWIPTSETKLLPYSVKEFLKEEEFVLPERWCIRITNDNKEIVQNWRKTKNCHQSICKNYIVFFDCTYGTSEKTWDYTEITFEQFKKYILKEETIENNIKVGTTFYFKNNTDFIYTISSFDGNNVEILWYEYSKEYSKTYTLDSLLNNIKDRTCIITTKEKTMEKKIIGYKLIKPEYKEAALKIVPNSGYLLTGMKRFSRKPYIEVNQGTTISDLKRAGVLDLWFEPVYEEKYKIGDYVTVIEAECGFNGQYGKTYKILGWQPECKNRFYYEENGKSTINIDVVKVRLATPEEIKAAESIEIGGYEVAFPLYKGGKICSINGVEYYRPEIVSLLNIMKKGQIKSLNVGCSGQYQVDLPLLEKILAKF
jgi:hypothetical protein